MENILSMFTPSEKEELLRLASDCKTYQTMESESKKAKESTKDKIKKILNKYGINESFVIGEYTIDYKEQEKTVADTDKMKAAGIYTEYSKKQVTKPLTVR